MHTNQFVRRPYRKRAFFMQTLFMIMFVDYCLRPQGAHAFAAKVEEDESVYYGGSESSVDEKVNQNDEIYAPELLQQEVEAMERKTEANLQPMNQNLNNQPSNENMPQFSEGKNWEKKSTQNYANSAEYYDDEGQIHKTNILKGTLHPNLKHEFSIDEKNNEATISASSEYDENTQEVRDKLREEILKSIQEELEHRKSRKHDHLEGSNKNIPEKRPQQLSTTQWNRNLNDFTEKKKSHLNKKQPDQYDEYYDDETPDKEYKGQYQRAAQANVNDSIYERRKTLNNTAISERKLTESRDSLRGVLQRTLSTDHSVTTAPNPPTLMPTTLMTTSTNATASPDVLFATSLPTPLALGSLKTTTPYSSKTTLQTLDTLTPTVATAATQTSIATTLRPGGKKGKQGKQINILRRKLQPHDKLRNYIEDAYIRMPLAVIVDPSEESLAKTKDLWRDALRTNMNIKIVLVSLNDSGAPAAYSFNSTRQFLTGLNSLKAQRGGDAFIGVVHASELVPYDSAVFISTSTLPPNTELIQDAAITLLKKRIRLYLLWFGERTLSENETQDSIGGILGEVAIRSGGDILHMVDGDDSQELESGNHMILVANTFKGPQEIEIPVDTTLSSLHVKVDAPTQTAKLETPNGDMNLKKFIKLNSHILPKEHLDAYVPLTKIRKATKLTLKIVPENNSEYFVFVRADRKADKFLEDMIKRFDFYFMEGVPYYPISLQDRHLNGFTSHESLKFPVEKTNNDRVTLENIRVGLKDQVETFSDIEIKNNTQEVAETNSTVNTTRGRTAFENQRMPQGRNLLQTSATRIEMGTQSQLIVEPGAMSQLFFEVTNSRSEPVYHNLQVVDERKYLARLLPQSLFLRPGETATVALTILVPPNTPQGTVDHITFTCQGSETASLSLNLKVNNALNAQDNNPPTLTWNFGSRCDYVAAESSNCAERIWTLDITAQDWESGILRLQSIPTSRLIYRNSYIVGSNEPVRATYAATCCEPKVSLVAFDVAGNQRTYNIDVRDIYLTEAAIAAIVLGCLLLLLLLALLIWAIVICCRRRKVVLDLPTYRSHSTRSME